MTVATSMGFCWHVMRTGGNSWDALTSLPFFLTVFSWLIIAIGTLVGLAMLGTTRTPVLAILVPFVLAAMLGGGLFAYAFQQQSKDAALGPSMFINGVPVAAPRPAQVATRMAMPTALYFAVWFVAFFAVGSRTLGGAGSKAT